MAAVLTLGFERKTDLTAALLAQNMSGFASGARVDPDGLTYHFRIGPADAHPPEPVANQVAVDLVPAGFAGTPPDLPPPPPPAPQDGRRLHPADDCGAVGRLSQFHAAGVRLAASRQIFGVSRRRQARHPVRDAGARRRFDHRALRGRPG
ncbi:MAG: hypothetical protein WDM81_19315 [Rhizomicrobium sp.]